MNQNIGTLQGTLPRAPKVFPGKKANVARFTVAIPRDDSKSTDYIDVVAFGKQADDIQRWGQPGTEVAVKITLQSSRRGEPGNFTYHQDVVATHVATTAGAKTVAQQAEAQAEAPAEPAAKPARKPRAKKAAADKA